jgi:putative ABC transport system permease protein
MTYNVARRRNEIGIRIALGSERGRLIRMVLGEFGWLLGIGLTLGTVLALGGTRLVASFLFGLSPSDPATIMGAALLFALVGLAAGGIPAWRASRVEPMTGLRQE